MLDVITSHVQVTNFASIIHTLVIYRLCEYEDICINYLFI